MRFLCVHESHRSFFLFVAVPVLVCLPTLRVSADFRGRLATICTALSGLDLNEDGIREIDRLTLSRVTATSPAADRPLVLVLVEERLLADLGAAAPAAAELEAVLNGYLADLDHDGWSAALIRADVYAGPRHQDGRTVLALRRLFQEVWRAGLHLAGAVLVGSFPEAYLVRSYNWRKKQKLVLHKGTPAEKRYDKRVWYLRTVPEPVANRCELVLSDLDGNWENLYHEPRERLPTVIGVFPDGVPPHGGCCREFEKGRVEFEDFFYVNDGRYECHDVLERKDDEWVVVGIDFRPLDAYEDSECTLADRVQFNPLARPEIVVSRINARGVALRPKQTLRGVDGNGLLDARGKPRSVFFRSKEEVPHWLDVWEQDPVLERKLLLEYFHRNHRFRQGVPAAAYRPAAVSCGLGNGFASLQRTFSFWHDFNAPGYRVGDKATLLDLVNWLKRPAVVRDVRAHSDPWGSSFGKCDLKALTKAAGGHPYSWSRKGNALVPSLHDACKGGKADLTLYRTLYENHVLPDSPCLYFHNGCNAISPPGARDRPYTDPDYDRWQGAEALLFYCQGVALIGRAKVFYDAPRGFYEALAQGKTFGDAWKQYFTVESEARSFAEVGGGIGRKRSYFWSVLGDWTLRLPPRL